MTAKIYQAGLNGALIIDGTVTAAELSQSALMTLAAQNPIHNGGFNIWQRGSSFASAASGVYADRWRLSKTGTAAVMDILRSTDVPSVAALVPLTNYSFHVDITTADASVDASDNIVILYRMEGYDWASFAQKQFTVGFWVKDTITGTHCVSAVNTGADRSCVMEYTVNVADTWEYKNVTFPASPSAGTWDYTTGVGVDLRWAIVCGSTWQGSAGSWQAAQIFATSSQINGASSTSNNFKLWGVTMGLGSTVAPFWPRSFGQELALCQRYYEKSYDYGTTPATSTQAGETLRIFSDNATSKNIMLSETFQVAKRSGPTITLYDEVGNSGKISTWSTILARTDNVTPSVGVGSSVGLHGFAVLHGGTVAGISYHYTASAEL